MKTGKRSWVMRGMAWILTLALTMSWNVRAEMPAQNQESSAAGESDSALKDGLTRVTVEPEEHFSAVNFMGGYTVRFLRNKPAENQEPAEEDVIAAADDVEVGTLSAVMEKVLGEEYLDAKWSHGGDYIVTGDLDVWLTGEDQAAASIGETEYPTLQSAIDAAGPDDTILLLKDVEENIWSVGQSYILDMLGHTIAPKSIDYNLYYLASGKVTLKNGKLTRNNGGTTNGAGLYIYQSEVTISQLEISDNRSKAYGSLFVYDSDVEAEHLTVLNNTSQSSGGGIAVWNGTLSLSNSQVSGNRTESISNNKGAGIYAYNSTVTLTDTEVSGNYGINGSGIYADRGVLSINGGTIFDNCNDTNYSSYGGGIYVTAMEKATIDGCDITGNSSRMGGGLFLSGGSSVEILNSKITGNKSLGDGGAALHGGMSSDGTLEIKNCTISGNEGSYAIFNTGSNYNLNLIECRIEENVSECSTICPVNIDIFMEDCTIRRNTANQGVGGIELSSFGTGSELRLSGTIVEENTGWTAGGLYLDSFGSVEITGGAICENRATDGNGANDLYLGEEIKDGARPELQTVTVPNASDMQDGVRDFSGYNWYDARTNTVFVNALSYTEETTADKLQKGQIYCLTAGRNVAKEYKAAQIIHAEGIPTQYTTIQEAIEAAGENETVQIISEEMGGPREISENIEVPAGKKLTLDLNGHTILADPSNPNMSLGIDGNLILTGKSGAVNRPVLLFGSLTVSGNITIETEADWDIAALGAQLLRIEGGAVDTICAITQSVEIAGGSIGYIFSDAGEYKITGGKISTSDGGKNICISGGEIETLGVPADCEKLLVSGAGTKLGNIELEGNIPITAAGSYNPEELVTIKLNDEVMDTLLTGKDAEGDPADPVVLIWPAEDEELAKGLEDKLAIEGSTVSVVVEKRDGKILAYFREITDIYLDGVNGIDAADGEDEDPQRGFLPEKPVKTFACARKLLDIQYEKLQKGELEGELRGIYVMDTVSVTDTQTWSLPAGMKMLRYYEGSDKFEKAMVKVSRYGNLTLKDLTLDGGGLNFSAKEALVKVEAGTLNIESGAVLQNNNHRSVDPAGDLYGGGAVCGFSGAKINMTGGSIVGNTSYAGGGILLIQDSELVMKEGTISDNCVIDCAGRNVVGGGIAVFVGSSVILEGGSISGNSVSCSDSDYGGTGGGIALGGTYSETIETTSGTTSAVQSPVLTMTGGTVSGNDSALEGGGIYVQAGAQAVISGGSITGNHSQGGMFGGGGIYVNGARSPIKTPGRLQLYNVIVSGNSAGYLGAGIAACETSKTEIYLKNGGAIYGNDGVGQVYIYKISGSNAIAEISEFMLGGGAYNWTQIVEDPLTREQTDVPMASDAMDGISYTKILNNAPAPEGKLAAENLKKVEISGNTAVTRGGGIGSNGTVIIGEADEQLTDIAVTKKWEDEEPETDKNGEVNYPTRPASVRIWLLRDGERVSSLLFSDQKSLTEKRWFKNLPAGDYEYTLEEEEISDAEAKQKGAYYETAIEKSEDGTYEFTVTNRLRKNLLIKKEAVNEISGVSADTEFVFEVEIKKKDGSMLNGSVKAQKKDGEITVPFVDGKAQIKLKAGEEIRLMGLPLQAGYTVTEQPEKGYIASVTTTVNGQTGVPEDGPVAQGVIQNGQTELAYRNVYHTSGSAQILAEKLLEGREWNGNDRFELQLTEITENGTGERLAAPLIQTADAGNHTVIFELSYTRPGEHMYQVEELPGTDAGITYDGRKYTVRTEAKDNGDGTLHVSVTYPEGEIVFRNPYHASGSLILKGTKRLLGGRKTLLADDEFTFRVTENGREVSAGKSKADGSIEFTEILYTEQDIGTHVYEIREVRGNDSNLTYSDAVLTVPVEVTDSGNGVLDARASYPTGGIVFENQYVQKQKAAVEVTKRLVYGGEGLIASDQTFYVALYSDEACTRLATDIRPLEFKNASSSVVEFSDLEPGRTYYVGECDAAGNAILSGVVSTGELFAVNFAQGRQSVVTEADQTVKFTFENEFFQIPEVGFYKEGELTITKNLLDADGSAAESDEVFYAGIFADAAYTIPSDRVTASVVPLDLNGGSSVSETVTVSIKPGESVTLYVTEVDKDGVPVEQSSGFAYEVSMDQTEVTLDESSPFAGVTITNQEAAEEEESETELTTETEEETEKKEEKPKSVRTGDDTPVTAWRIIALLSLCDISLLLFAGRRRKKGI